MKISELIQILERVKQNSGDTEVIISVHDQYSRFGNDAELHVDITGTIWFGCNTGANQTRIRAELVDKVEFNGTRKRAKVTYR